MLDKNAILSSLSDSILEIEQTTGGTPDNIRLHPETFKIILLNLSMTSQVDPYSTTFQGIPVVSDTSVPKDDIRFDLKLRATDCIHDAAKPEPKPMGDGVDVGAKVSEYLRERRLFQMAGDLESRLTFGEKKYGTRLKSHNGRNALMDAYQELLDFLNYSMQGHIEGREGCLEVFQDAVRLTYKVQGLMGIIGKMTVKRTSDYDEPVSVDAAASVVEEIDGFRMPFSEFEKLAFGKAQTSVYKLNLEGERESNIETDIIGADREPTVDDTPPPTEFDNALAAEMDNFEVEGEVVKPKMTFITYAGDKVPPVVIDSEADLPLPKVDV
jgi:hypothetical protein